MDVLARPPIADLDPASVQATAVDTRVATGRSEASRLAEDGGSWRIRASGVTVHR